MEETTIKEQLLAAITSLQESHYENCLLRGLLKYYNPAGWQSYYQQEMLNWDRRNEHGAPFREALELVERQSDPDFLLRLLVAKAQLLKLDFDVLPEGAYINLLVFPCGNCGHPIAFPSVTTGRQDRSYFGATSLHLVCDHCQQDGGLAFAMDAPVFLQGRWNFQTRS